MHLCQPIARRMCASPALANAIGADGVRPMTTAGSAIVVFGDVIVLEFVDINVYSMFPWQFS